MQKLVVQEKFKKNGVICFAVVDAKKNRYVVSYDKLKKEMVSGNFFCYNLLLTKDNKLRFTEEPTKAWKSILSQAQQGVRFKDGGLHYYLEDGRVAVENLSSDLETAKILNGVEFIPEEGFASSGNLKTVILPKEVKEIGTNAFADCRKLERVLMPNVEIIGDYAFAYCDSLKEIVIPKSVKHIGKLAFGGCFELCKITLPLELKKYIPIAFDTRHRFDCIKPLD